MHLLVVFSTNATAMRGKLGSFRRIHLCSRGFQAAAGIGFVSQISRFALALPGLLESGSFRRFMFARTAALHELRQTHPTYIGFGPGQVNRRAASPTPVIPARVKRRAGTHVCANEIL